MYEPFLTQPQRLRIPQSTLAKYRLLWILDTVFGVAGLLAIVVAALTVRGGALVGVVALAALALLLPATIGFVTGIPGYRAARQIERGERALLYAARPESGLALSTGTQPGLHVRPGDYVTVHAGPNLRQSLFYVVVALKWTIAANGRAVSFSTHFEPDAEFFAELQRSLEAHGAVVAMTYRPLSHSLLFADM
jgi:hypothetical protein